MSEYLPYEFLSWIQDSERASGGVDGSNEGVFNRPLIELVENDVFLRDLLSVFYDTSGIFYCPPSLVDGLPATLTALNNYDQYLRDLLGVFYDSADTFLLPQSLVDGLNDTISDLRDYDSYLRDLLGVFYDSADTFLLPQTLVDGLSEVVNDSISLELTENSELDFTDYALMNVKGDAPGWVVTLKNLTCEAKRVTLVGTSLTNYVTIDVTNILRKDGTSNNYNYFGEGDVIELIWCKPLNKFIEVLSQVTDTSGS